MKYSHISSTAPRPKSDIFLFHYISKSGFPSISGDVYKLTKNVNASTTTETNKMNGPVKKKAMNIPNIEHFSSPVLQETHALLLCFRPSDGY